MTPDWDGTAHCQTLRLATGLVTIQLKRAGYGANIRAQFNGRPLWISSTTNMRLAKMEAEIEVAMILMTTIKQLAELHPQHH